MAGATVPAPLLSVFVGFVSPPRRASLAEALVAWEGFVLGPKTLRIHSMMHVHLGQLCFPHPTHWDAHGHPHSMATSYLGTLSKEGRLME